MIVRGKLVKNGCGHFSQYRAKFYAAVEERTGIKLHQGTLNIRCDPQVFASIPDLLLRIEGVDEIDIKANQDLLIGPCSIRGIQGYRILPVVRPNIRAGHDTQNIIEVSLADKLPDIRDGDELEVNFP